MLARAVLAPSASEVAKVDVKPFMLTAQEVAVGMLLDHSS